MKYIIILLFLPIFCNAQKRLTIQYADFEITSRNVGITFSQQKGKNTFYAGIKCHLDDNIGWLNNIYYRNLYAENFMQHFGLIGGYERNISKLKSKNRLRLTAFYDMNLSITGIRDSSRIYDVIKKTSYNDIIAYGPVYFLENNVGIGAYLKLNDSYLLNLRIGGGICNHWRPNNGYGYRKEFLWTKGLLSWDFTRLFSVGVTYEFDNPKP
jgi:hypothetical protein